MAGRIEDYALIGNCETGALVGIDGSIDWLCLPRFDSPACFSALLGDPQNGRWLVAPDEPVLSVERRYNPETLILETRFTTAHGRVLVVDFMPLPRQRNDLRLIRLVVGERGTVRMRTEMILRFDYGRVVPWVRATPTGIRAVAGPDAVSLRSSVPLQGKDMTTVAAFSVSKGQTESFVLGWFPSHLDYPHPIDPVSAFHATQDYWRGWSARCTVTGRWRDAVLRSLLTLKALTYAPTGGIAAALTTSLPEFMGGNRNWDYRYCWMRDATFTLFALLSSGYQEEARAWREWLLRAVAGAPSQIQVMYGIGGERQLPERELEWLAGYENSRPVRIGNAASLQRQTDVYGEVIDSFFCARMFGIEGETDAEDAVRVQTSLIEYLEGNWQLPDSGIWEARLPEQRNTHSAIMAWVALDRGVRSAKHFGVKVPHRRWRALRDQIHREVCAQGIDPDRGVFVQSFGSKALDASLLRIPLVGFLPPTDIRVKRTVDAIARELMVDGMVMRYRAEDAPDGLPPGEGTFLLCSFWMVDNLVLMGRRRKAQAMFERLLDLRNDVGLLAEEYDPVNKRFLGNFPQAFSHVGLVNSAHLLGGDRTPTRHLAVKAKTHALPMGVGGMFPAQ